MRRIIEYLDDKADRIKQISPTDPAPYATSKELVRELHANDFTVWKSVRILLSQSRIRLYPQDSPDRRKRKYGSVLLPQISHEDLVREVAPATQVMVVDTIMARG